MEKKLIECRTGCCLRRTLAAGRFSEDRCWGTMKMNDETVKGLLRKAGLKVTNQRMMVLDIIASHPAEHLTAEEIYDLAKVNSPEIGLATIYRTVQVLLDLHVIDKVTFDDGFTRYELNGEGKRGRDTATTMPSVPAAERCIPWNQTFWTVWKRRLWRNWAFS